MAEIKQPPSRRFNMRVPTELFWWLQSYAQARGWSMSQVVVHALERLRGKEKKR